jgi:hypothetical protein
MGGGGAMARVGPQRHRKKIIINKLMDFITKTDCVYCAVRTECLIVINFLCISPLNFVCFGSAIRQLVDGL